MYCRYESHLSLILRPYIPYGHVLTHFAALCIDDNIVLHGHQYKYTADACTYLTRQRLSLCRVKILFISNHIPFDSFLTDICTVAVKAMVTLSVMGFTGRKLLNPIFYYVAKSRSHEAFLSIILTTVLLMSFVTQGMSRI